VLGWCDELRTLGVRANADTPVDAAKAIELGAEGIGLCRTEHMFLGERQPLMAAMIMAEDDGARAHAIEQLRPLQEADFEQILRRRRAPVTVRLLDPPLHEFLPHPADLPEGSAARKRVEQLQEANPMLGTRGVRLGILFPELYEMQVRALFAAASNAPGARIEVMVPLVAYERELELTRELIERVAAEHPHADYLIGTMIELPRACFQADRIAVDADFFSFGTNDLTQTALGFSRDDIEGRVLARYIDVKILDRSPFETLDTPGVGQMVRMGAWLGRQRKPELKLGVCGEHRRPRLKTSCTTPGLRLLCGRAGSPPRGDPHPTLRARLSHRLRCIQRNGHGRRHYVSRMLALLSRAPIAQRQTTPYSTRRFRLRALVPVALTAAHRQPGGNLMCARGRIVEAVRRRGLRAGSLLLDQSHRRRRAVVDDGAGPPDVRPWADQHGRVMSVDVYVRRHRQHRRSHRHIHGHRG
jgi:hypothetical protein